MSNDKENSFYVPLTGILVSIKTITTTTTTKTEIVMPAFRPKLIHFFLILTVIISLFRYRTTFITLI